VRALASEATMRAVIALAAVVVTAGAVRSAEINVMLTDALGTSFNELAPKFARTNGHTIHEMHGPSGGLVRRLNAGEPADVIFINDGGIDDLIKQGKLQPGRTNLTRTGIGIAVRRGAPKPDVSTPEALKRALLDARSIGYTNPAGGGLTAAPIMAMIERLGITAQMAPKTRLAAGGPTGRVSTLVANGEAEIGMQMVSELLSNPELEVIGMLPPELQLITVYSAGITANAKEPDAARALVRFLATPEAAAVYKARGLGL
jgi:molybdate transport system substrate-binding protein